MAQVNFRIDDDLKRNVEQLYKRLGLTLSAAFTLFANQSLACHGLPFEVRERGFTENDGMSEREQIMRELAMCSQYAREHKERLSTDEVFDSIKERIHAGRRLQVGDENRNHYDFSGFFGKVKFPEDGVAFQRRLRDEW